MLCVCQRVPSLPTGIRAFSTSTRRPASLGLSANDKNLVKNVVPAYPYGPTRYLKRAAKGLYGGTKIQFGNTSGDELRQRFRRTWLPNVKTKRLYSKALRKMVQIDVTTSVLRTIDKVGGLDEYLLGDKEARIKELGEAGWWLRWAIMQTDTIQRRFESERRRLEQPEVTAQQAAVQEQVEEIIEQFAVPDDNPGIAVTEASSTLPSAVAPLVDAPEAQLLQSPESIDSKKREIKFRINRTKYLTLRDGQWTAISSERRRLHQVLKQLSPTASLQTWDVQEQKRIGRGSGPSSDTDRKQWFQAQQVKYRQTQKRLDNTEAWKARKPEKVATRPSKKLRRQPE